MNISLCLWFKETKGKEALAFYKSVFNEALQVRSENPMAQIYTLYDQALMHLNHAADDLINPSFSFFINLEDKQQLQTLFTQLSDGGKVLMPFQAYPWSEAYGWCADAFGVNWQLMYTEKSSAVLVPNFMFTQAHAGKVSQAHAQYLSIFKDAEVILKSTYAESGADLPDYVSYSQFRIANQLLCASESSHAHEFVFNDGASIVLHVDTQDEIDYYWDQLTKGGKPGRCGWLVDAFGISWQVVPKQLSRYMSDPITAPKVSYAFMQMSKLNIAALEAAAQS
ncbi:MAG: 2-polyprenyl-6-hydroxyphenol methylase [Bacteroidota bacterium]|jgi:predicted 3-demethylubiquinone-9 3-methyltransferase (glyoxalase superfamily)